MAQDWGLVLLNDILPHVHYYKAHLVSLIGRAWLYTPCPRDVGGKLEVTNLWSILMGKDRNVCSVTVGLQND